MKKTNVYPLQEVLASHVNTLGDYVENALELLTNRFLRVSDGVLAGYDFSSGGLLTANIGTGAIIQTGLIGELEATSAIVLQAATSGTRIDTIVAKYAQVEDTPVANYNLLDVTTRQETIITQNSRRFGASQIYVFQNTTSNLIPSGYIPLWEVTVNTLQIVSTSDVRLQARVTRFDEDLGLNFKLMFYSGF